jgi:hypothetical protein
MKIQPLLLIITGVALWYYFKNDTGNTADKRAYLIAMAGDVPADTWGKLTDSEIDVIYDAVFNYTTKAKAIPADLLARVQSILLKYGVVST